MTPDVSHGAESLDPQAVAREIAAIGHRCHARGWALGSSGNFSAVVSRFPFRLAITASGCNKRNLHPSDIVSVDASGAPVPKAKAEPSAETPLHVAIALATHAGAILHTHSVWSTILSGRDASARGLTVAGYEMLKGLSGVATHEHSEWIPIFDNDQDMSHLACRVSELLQAHPLVHAVLLRRHGLYTWGKTLDDAERHIEVLEFLFESLCRK